MVESTDDVVAPMVESTRLVAPAVEPPEHAVAPAVEPPEVPAPPWSSRRGRAPAVEPPEDAVAPVVEPPEDLQAVVELWPAVVELVGAGQCAVRRGDRRHSPGGARGRGSDRRVSDGAAFLKKKAEDPANRQIVTEALRQLAGGRRRISYELREDLDDAGGDGAARAYTEEEWIERFKAELDAEEIPRRARVQIWRAGGGGAERGA